jgi:hypothetical protein
VEEDRRQIALGAGIDHCHRKAAGLNRSFVHEHFDSWRGKNRNDGALLFDPPGLSGMVAELFEPAGQELFDSALPASSNHIRPK